MSVRVINNQFYIFSSFPHARFCLFSNQLCKFAYECFKICATDTKNERLAHSRMIFIIKIKLNLLCLVTIFAWKAGYIPSQHSRHNSVSLWITRKPNSILLLRAKTEQQLCNRMWCHKSVDHRYTRQLPGAIRGVPPAPTPRSPPLPRKILHPPLGKRVTIIIIIIIFIYTRLQISSQKNK